MKNQQRLLTGHEAGEVIRDHILLFMSDGKAWNAEKLREAFAKHTVILPIDLTTKGDECRIQKILFRMVRPREGTISSPTRNTYFITKEGFDWLRERDLPAKNERSERIWKMVSEFPDAKPVKDLSILKQFSLDDLYLETSRREEIIALLDQRAEIDAKLKELGA